MVREWMSQGLNWDVISLENSVLLQNSCWPLLIDSTNQVNKWVKQMEAKVQIYVLSQKKLNFINYVKKAMKNGFSVLIEVRL